MRVRAIRIHETGGPEVLRWEEVEIGRPGPAEVLLRHTAIGLNFIDTYHRTGLYPLDLPAVLGGEGGGVSARPSIHATRVIARLTGCSRALIRKRL
jgi:NADPH:quinone reductase-like Zn-dependent oxidoreductase